jgi:uncharacterized glyoxalase superfamily protein PhnB
MKVEAIIPVFFVTDVTAAVRYYVDALGFKEAFRYGTYAGLSFSGCELHLTDSGDTREVVGSGTAYIICDEVDQHYALLKASGARLKRALAKRSYGMRDFSVFDPDGNQITFGCDADE